MKSFLKVIKFFSQKLEIKLYRILLLVLSYCFLAFSTGVLLSHSPFFLKFFEDLNKLEHFSPEHFVEGMKTWIDDDKKVHDGLLLVTTNISDDSKIKSPAILVDKNGNIIHQWFYDVKSSNNRGFSEVFHAHLFSDGSILLMIDEELVKLDKDSNIIWKLHDKAENNLFHHWFDVASDGFIYVLTNVVNSINKSTLLRGKISDDSPYKYFYYSVAITKVTKDGKIVDHISISEAINNSKLNHYTNLTSEKDGETARRFIGSHKHKKGKGYFEEMHANTVQYISKDLSQKFFFAKEGDFLLSFRNMDMIAILRPSTQEIVWHKRGPWRSQHHVKLMPSGKIRIFDNEGGGIIKYDASKKDITYQVRSRLLQYDPITEKSEVIYHDDVDRKLQSFWLSGFQEIDNDNFIIFSSERSRIIQIDENKNIVWELRGVKDRDQDKVHDLAKISHVKYYDSNDLEFLK